MRTKMFKWPFIARTDRKPSMINEDAIVNVHSSSSKGDLLNHVPEEGDKLKLPAFKEYTLDQLNAATGGYSVEIIVSQDDENAPNVVSLGKLEDEDRFIAIKRFNRSPWPDARLFLQKLWDNLGARD